MHGVSLPEVRSFLDLDDVEDQLKQRAKIEGRIGLGEIRELLLEHEDDRKAMDYNGGGSLSRVEDVIFEVL